MSLSTVFVRSLWSQNTPDENDKSMQVQVMKNRENIDYNRIEVGIRSTIAMIAQALSARTSPMRMAIIYFLALSVFSSSHRDMIYMIPTIQIPSTLTIAVIS